MDRFRVICPLDTKTLVSSAYSCTDESAAREILLTAAPDQHEKIARLIAQDRSRILIAAPGKRSVVPRQEIDGESWSWQRHIPIPFHGTKGSALVLAVSGTTTFKPLHPSDPTHHGTKNRTRWIRSIVRLPADAYVVWNRADADSGPIEAMSKSPDGDKTSVILQTGTKMRGVAFSRRYAYDDATGEPNAYLNRLLLLTVRVKFGPRPCVNIELERHSTTSGLKEPKTSLPPGSEFIVDGWESLLLAAYEGFKTHCRPERAETEAQRTFFTDQIDKEDRDDELNGAGYGSRIRKLDWQEALATVAEPWQLAVVVDHHGTRFADEDRTYSKVVSKMLSEHVCDEARKALLQQMSDTYLQRVTDGWDKPFLD